MQRFKSGNPSGAWAWRSSSGLGNAPERAHSGRVAPSAMSSSAVPVSEWKKSRHSNPSGNCVELALVPEGGIAVRNSRYPEGPVLVYTRAEIMAFVHGVKDGEFDDMIAAVSDAV